MTSAKKLATMRQVMQRRRKRTMDQGLCSRCGCRSAAAPDLRCQRCIDYMVDYRERVKHEKLVKSGRRAIEQRHD